jgi:hypothetical protein
MERVIALALRDISEEERAKLIGLSPERQEAHVKSLVAEHRAPGDMDRMLAEVELCDDYLRRVQELLDQDREAAAARKRRQQREKEVGLAVCSPRALTAC